MTADIESIAFGRDIQLLFDRSIRAWTGKVIRNDGSIILPPGGPTGDGYPARPHASTHAFPGGSDPLDPASIGAATQADFDSHRTASTIDHPDGSITLVKLDAAGQSGKAPVSNGTVAVWTDIATQAELNALAATVGGGGTPPTGPYLPLEGGTTADRTVLTRTDFGTFAAPLSTVAGVFYGTSKGVQAQAVSTDPAATGVVGQGITGVVGQADDGAGGDVGEVGVGVQGYGEVGVEGLGYGVGGAGIKGVGQSSSRAGWFEGGAVEIYLPTGQLFAIYAAGGSTPVATIDKDGVLMAQKIQVAGNEVEITLDNPTDLAGIVIRNAAGTKRVKLEVNADGGNVIARKWSTVTNNYSDKATLEAASIKTISGGTVDFSGTPSNIGAVLETDSVWQVTIDGTLYNVPVIQA